MANSTHQLLKCGERDVCTDCSLLRENPELAELVACHQENQLGFCDFYDGPEKQIITVGAPQVAH